MKITQTEFKDLLVCEPKIYEDHRGYFFESFNSDRFVKESGLKIKFVQDNQSSSKFGVLRGLHFQKGTFAQSKLVRVLKGEVLDVVVDMREEESTFGNYFSIELSAKNKKQLFVPKGFAHGFVVLSKEADLFYKCDNYYAPGFEGAVAWDDEDLNINWEVPLEKIILSEKDKNNPTFREAMRSLKLNE